MADEYGKMVNGPRWSPIWWRQDVVQPILEPPRWIPVMFRDIARPRLDFKAANIISVEAGCLMCDETLPAGRIAYFCGETCERAFRERYLDLELPDLRTDRKPPDLE